MKNKLLAAGVIAAVLLISPTAFAAPAGYIADGTESVAGIAARFSLDAELLGLINDMNESDMPARGSLLRLPSVPCVSVTAAAGESIAELAKRAAADGEETAELNGIPLEAKLSAGQKILIPLSEESAIRSDIVTEEAAVTALAGGAVRYGWPVQGVITSPFGKRNGSFHHGLDIAVDKGTPVTASAAGTVESAGWIDGYGYAVILDHGGDRRTLYAHASRLAVKEGQYVPAGSVIAYAGSTGNSTGPHVHFEIRLNDICVDPLEYLPEGGE